MARAAPARARTPTVRFCWREPVAPLRGKRDLDPEKIGRIVESLSSDDKPRELVQRARSPRHHLHRAFEWDDRIAAERHRRDTALRIIRSVWRIEDNNPPEPVVISISVPETGRDFYKPSEVIDNARLQRLLAAQAQRDLESWAKRYSMLLRNCPNAKAAQVSLAAYLRDLGL
jgi:hypothetical protein